MKYILTSSHLVLHLAITRIQTSYVSVEPKKRREYGPSSSISEKEASGSPRTETGATSATTGTTTRPQAIDSSLQATSAGLGTTRIDQPGASTISASPGKPRSSAGTLRRARIVITVKRTEAYKKWLEDNPIHDTHAGQDDDHI